MVKEKAVKPDKLVREKQIESEVESEPEVHTEKAREATTTMGSKTKIVKRVTRKNVQEDESNKETVVTSTAMINQLKVVQHKERGRTHSTQELPSFDETENSEIENELVDAENSQEAKATMAVKAKIVKRVTRKSVRESDSEKENVTTLTAKKNQQKVIQEKRRVIINSQEIISSSETWGEKEAANYRPAKKIKQKVNEPADISLSVNKIVAETGSDNEDPSKILPVISNGLESE